MCFYNTIQVLFAHVLITTGILSIKPIICIIWAYHKCIISSLITYFEGILVSWVKVFHYLFLKINTVWLTMIICTKVPSIIWSYKKSGITSPVLRTSSSKIGKKEICDQLLYVLFDCGCGIGYKSNPFNMYWWWRWLVTKDDDGKFFHHIFQEQTI